MCIVESRAALDTTTAAACTIIAHERLHSILPSGRVALPAAGDAAAAPLLLLCVKETAAGDAAAQWLLLRRVREAARAIRSAVLSLLG